MVTIFGQHYFHNVDLRYASINIMEIMLTKKSDIIVHNSISFFKEIPKLCSESELENEKNASVLPTFLKINSFFDKNKTENY